MEIISKVIILIFTMKMMHMRLFLTTLITITKLNLSMMTTNHTLHMTMELYLMTSLLTEEIATIPHLPVMKSMLTNILKSDISMFQEIKDLRDLILNSLGTKRSRWK